MRRPSATAARMRSQASSMSPSRNGSWPGSAAARNARAAAGSSNPRRTRTHAVNSLTPSSRESSTTDRCGHWRSVQMPSFMSCTHATEGAGRHTAARMRELFLLDPDVVYLNHGAYGACPRPVFERYRWWQRELEREPSDFFGRRLAGLLDESLAALAEFVGARPDDLTFVPNATTGVNLAA